MLYKAGTRFCLVPDFNNINFCLLIFYSDRFFIFYHDVFFPIFLKRPLVHFCLIHWYIPANISCFPRLLEDVFSVTIFHLPRRLQEVFTRPLPKTSSRRICKTSSSRRLAIMSWRRLQRNNSSSSKTSSRRVCKTSSRDVFKTFSTRLQDVSVRLLLQDVLQLCLEDVLKDKKYYAEDVFKTSSVRLHQDEYLLG